MFHKRKKGPVRSKKKVVDGIEFKSGLEAYMHTALKEANIKAEYEGRTYKLIDGFNFTIDCYEKQANGKGEFKNRGNKNILGMKYTPDFIGEGFIIECKGRANESFPIRWKIFKKYVNYQLRGVTLYKPQNQKECDETVRLIIGSQNSKRD
tara:strand:- start:56 stop:508 length:453 start_codon:yes stop_codon:yes gene_type:complete